MSVLQPTSAGFYENAITNTSPTSGGGEGYAPYLHQIHNVLKLQPQSVLVIGQGDNIVPSILRGLVMHDIEVDTFDFVEDMKPTYVGDVRQLDKIVERRYDVILCCEVLEHLPFAEFAGCLQKISMLNRKGVVLSLPIFGISGYIKVGISGFKHFTIPVSIRYFKPGWKVMCKQHHWEINDRNGTKKRDVIRVIEEHFTIRNHYRAKDVPYHMFFELENKA